MKYSLLCLNSNVYSIYRHAHTMVLTYLIHCSHILSTVLTAYDTVFCVHPTFIFPAGNEYLGVKKAHFTPYLCDVVVLVCMVGLL